MAVRLYANMRSANPFTISIRPDCPVSTNAVGDASTTRANRSSTDSLGHEGD
jgi:hypothetical protein